MASADYSRGILSLRVIRHAMNFFVGGKLILLGSVVWCLYRRCCDEDWNFLKILCIDFGPFSVFKCVRNHSLAKNIPITSLAKPQPHHLSTLHLLNSAAACWPIFNR